MTNFSGSFLCAVALLSAAGPVAVQADFGVCPSEESIAREIVTRVNALRAVPRRCGSEAYGPSEPLAWSKILQRAAAGHASGMSRHGYFDHKGRDGASPGERASRAGYDWSIAGENIAWGQLSVTHVIKRWVESPDHCANIMDPRFVEFGVACSVKGQKEGRAEPYWDMLLAAPWPAKP